MDENYTSTHSCAHYLSLHKQAIDSIEIVMSTVLQVGSQIVTADEILARIRHYQLLPKLKRELIIDQAITTIDCTSEQIDQAQQQLVIEYQLESPEAKQAFCRSRDLTIEDLPTLLTRLIRIEKFKHQNWSAKLPSYFLQRKQSLDQVIYSFIQLKDEEIVREFYFRLREQEQSFTELVQEYSKGAKAQVGGVVGPVELGTIHPELANLLAISQPGQLWHPIPIGDSLLIVRLEMIVPAQLSAAMHQRLLDELFEAWLQERLSEIF